MYRAQSTLLRDSGTSLLVGVDGLSPFTFYSFNAAFTTSGGEGVLSSSASEPHRTLQGIPNAPVLRNLRVTSEGVLVQWESPGDAAGPLDYYTVYVGNVDNGTETGVRVAAETATLLRDLQAGTTYTIAVTASTSTGESERSRVLTHTVPAVNASAASGVSDATLAGVALAVVLVIALVLAALLWYSRRQQQSKGQELELQLQSLKVNADKLADDVRVLFSREFADTIGDDLAETEARFSRLEVERSQLELDNELGKGAFGVVYRGTLARNGRRTPVAVKTMLEGVVQDELTKFLVEARLMSLLQHENLLQIVAVCTRDTPFYLVTEFMPKVSHFFDLAPCCVVLCCVVLCLCFLLARRRTCW